MNDVIIKLSDKFAEISYRDSSNAQVNKIVDIADLHSIFKDNVNHDTGELGVMGEGAMGVRRVISRGNKLFVLVNAINPCANITFQGQEIQHVYFPSLLMAVHLTKSGIKYNVCKNKTLILAHEHIIGNGQTPMYRFPFANVWDGVGRICWGSVNLPRLDNPGQSLGIMQMFIQEDMNNDLFNNSKIKAVEGTNYENKVGSVETLLKTLSKNYKKLTSFPYQEILMHKKMTYQELISHCESNI